MHRHHHNHAYCIAPRTRSSIDVLILLPHGKVTGKSSHPACQALAVSPALFETTSISVPLPRNTCLPVLHCSNAARHKYRFPAAVHFRQFVYFSASPLLAAPALTQDHHTQYIPLREKYHMHIIHLYQNNRHIRLAHDRDTAE